MPAVAKFGKRDRPGHNSLQKISENLRSQLTRIDLLVGLGAAVVLTVLLVVFHYHSVPEYQAGDVATSEVRALQDVIYQDQPATAQERAAARERSQAVYDFNGALIVRIERDLGQAFSTARNILAEKKVPSKGVLEAAEKAELLPELESSLGRTVPPKVLPLLLQERFNASLEGRIVRILDTVLRGCIVDDEGWSQFLRDQRRGIVVRDNTQPAERTLAEAYMARNRTAAREYLRQLQSEFAELSARDRAQLLGFLDTLLVPNLLYNQTETEVRREAAGSRVAPVEITIKQGKPIVRKGEIVTPAMVVQLEALRREQRPHSFLAQFVGFFFFIAAFLYGLWRSFILYQHRHRKIRHQTLLILLVLVAVFVVIRLLTGLSDILSERLPAEAFPGLFQLYYMIPFAFGAILVALLVDVNLGIMTSLLVATLTGLFYGDSYIAAYAVLGSLAGVYSVRHYKDRAAILKAGLTIGVVNMTCILGIDCLRQAPMTFWGTTLQLSSGFISGALASALASTLLPTLESLFKITTDIRLLELSNLNAPMLRRLSVEAPGTYHHSLMLATLAETAAEAIEANSLLVRVGAYYHDLGKMLKPEYYVENQSFGINKHEALSPNMSCLIIASHVKDGLELAKEMGLTQDICDLIPQHHGTRIMSYFYRKALDAINGKEQEIDEVDFRYPGPKPQTKEAAILMMADCIEAASRTLTDPSPAQLQGMIDRLVDSVLADNQLDECDITLREIGLAKESFFKILTGFYHHRLDYPGYDFKAVEERPDKIPLTNSSPKHAKAI
ncbi:MAG: HDIG domain-containing protein [Acidobacteriia bacterium]|nr:HDIG domain-containing protein [Terriglobia bacterium]